jgi:hypothetical protein
MATDVRSVSIDHDLNERLREAAFKVRKPVSRIISDLVTAWLATVGANHNA